MLRYIAAAVVIIVLVLVGGSRISSCTESVTDVIPDAAIGLGGTSEDIQYQYGTVTRVVDGDTIKVDIGGTIHTVRYIGIDTPETVDPRKDVQPFGPEASTKNTELVMGEVVRLEKDVSDTDRYDRLLRYVYVDDLFVNAELVRLGYAQVSTYPPDVKYTDLFLQLQKEAKEANRGLWGVH